MKDDPLGIYVLKLLGLGLLSFFIPIFLFVLLMKFLRALLVWAPLLIFLII